MALLAAAGLMLAACSGSGGTSGGTSTSASASATPQPSSSASSATSSSEPASGQGAIAAIEANWATFFDAKTPISRRIALLQNGSDFATVLKTQAESPLVRSFAATSKVSHVTLSGTSQAYVTYAILVGGKPALSNQHGVAVYQNGVWKVGISSFCGLLKLENAGKSSGLPSGCQG